MYPNNHFYTIPYIHFYMFRSTFPGMIQSNLKCSYHNNCYCSR